jgi:hypothetical protein
LSYTLIGLLRRSHSLDRNALIKLCENIRDGPSDIGYPSNYLRNLIDNSVAILNSRDKRVLRPSFVKIEEYATEKKKWSEIDLRNAELKSSLDQ